MIKAQLMISGCWLTKLGAAAWLGVRFYFSIIGNNGLTLPAFHDAILGNPWMPGFTQPGRLEEFG